MRTTSKLRAGLALVAVGSCVAAAPAAAASTPTATASATKAASKRYIRTYVRQYLDSRLNELRGPQGPQGPSGPAGRATPTTTTATAVATKLDYRVRQNQQSTPLYDFQGLELRADCDNQGNMTLMFRTSVQNSMLYFFGADPDTDSPPTFNAGVLNTTLPSFSAGGLPVLVFEPNFDVGRTVPIGSSNTTDITQNIGNVQYTTPDGRHVSIIYQAADRSGTGAGPLGGTSDCVFAGSAVTS